VLGREQKICENLTRTTLVGSGLFVWEKKMALLDGVLQLLACPACHGPLTEAAEYLVCPACRLKFPVRDGIPVLLLDAAQPA
jgi:uncharacterized protein